MTDDNDHWKTVEHRSEIEAAAELFGGVGVSRPEVEQAVRTLLAAVGEDIEGPAEDRSGWRGVR
jgi:hypothetical protein